MDATLSRENVKKSLTKYFVDNLEPTYVLVFDKWFEVIDEDKWISFNFGRIDLGKICSAEFTIICLARYDTEAKELNELVDVVMNIVVSDESDVKRIDLYDTDVDGKITDKIGGLVLILNSQGKDDVTADKTKYVPIEMDIKWGAKL